MAESFNAGTCEPNCETRTDLDLVTDLASLANFERPPLLSSVSMGCFRAVMSRNVSRNSTTKSRSFFIGAICNSSHNGVSGGIGKKADEKGVRQLLHSESAESGEKHGSEKFLAIREKLDFTVKLAKICVCMFDVIWCRTTRIRSKLDANLV